MNGWIRIVGQHWLAYLYVYGKGSVDADDSEAKYPYFFRTVASNEHDKYLNVFSYYSMCQFAKIEK